MSDLWTINEDVTDLGYANVRNNLIADEPRSVKKQIPISRMLLNLGELDGVRVFKPETVNLMTSVQTPENVTGRRGLGWDIGSGYSGPRGRIFPVGSYGHTGWTGTSLWIDPFSKTFVIFLSNRNHPTEKGNVGALRAQLGTLAAEAVSDFDFAHVPGALASRESAEASNVSASVN